MDEELLKEVKKEIHKVSPAVDVSDGAAGSRFGQWKIEQLLGRNSIGELYLAKKADDSASSELVTLRSFDSSLSRNPRLVKRFLQEAEKAAEVDHPRIARVLDFGRTENGTAFMVRQYVTGETLQSLLKDGPVEVGTAIEIALAVCSALEAADKCGLLHRSLNPSNIIIDKDGKVSVVDFGLSKSVPAEGRDTRGLTNYNDRREDMRYVSPEQIKEDRLDIRSDIYSLGCIINVLFTGDEILASLDGFRLLKAKMKGSIDSDSFKRMNFSGQPRERQKTSERAALIVQRAICGERKFRYESPAELAEDLNRLNKGKELQSATVAALKEIESAGISQLKGEKTEADSTPIGLLASSIKKPVPVLIVVLLLALLFFGIRAAFPGLFVRVPIYAGTTQSPRPDRIVSPAPHAGAGTRVLIPSAEVVAYLPGVWEYNYQGERNYMKFDHVTSSGAWVRFAGLISNDSGVHPFTGRLGPSIQEIQLDYEDCAPVFLMGYLTTLVRRAPSSKDLIFTGHLGQFKASKCAENVTQVFKGYQVEPETTDALKGWWTANTVTLFPLPKRIYLKSLGQEGLFEVYAADANNPSKPAAEPLQLITIDNKGVVRFQNRQGKLVIDFDKKWINVQGTIAAEKDR